MSWYCEICGGSETSCTCNATSNAIRDLTDTLVKTNSILEVLATTKIEEIKAIIEILMKEQVK